jgi:VanZ family protein
LIRALWLAAGWTGVAAVVWLSLMPHPPSIDIEDSDKALHLAAYAVLMLWFAQVRTGRPERRITALLLVGLGIALELAQGLSGYRWLSVADMAANTTGVALGWLAAPPRLPNAFVWVSSMRDRVQPAGSRTRGSIQP